MRKPAREREEYLTGWDQPRRAAPLAVRAATGLAAGSRVVPAAVRRAAWSVLTETAVLILVAAALAVFHHAALHQLAPPAVPSSEQVCGSSSLNGPSSPPGGAVTVPAGDNSGFTFTTPGTTYWFAAGTHTLGSGPFNQIQSASNSVYEGAPGAVIDGQGLNDFAFVSTSANVTIEYLTIQDFKPPGSQGAVNQDGEPGWTIAGNTIQDNVPGAAMMVGTGNSVTGNCLTQNGEYGFNGFTVTDVSAVTGGPSDITMTGNEISDNDTCNWENVSPWPYPSPPAGCAGAGQFSGCGCSGAGKFWEADQGTFANNYVHDNYAVGAWWDTNDNGWDITGNYFSNNFGQGIIYEISYNASITGNTFTRNGVTAGQAGLATGNTIPAVYISESGSDPRVAGAYGSGFQIAGNGFYDNWDGVTLWENADRFCSSIANTSSGACTLVNPAASLSTCTERPTPQSPSRPVRGGIPSARRTPPRAGSGQGQNFLTLLFQRPWIDDCRWKTQNVQVAGNLFDFSAPDLGGLCNNANFCGFNGLYSQFGSFPPYQGFLVPDDITYSQANLYSGNTYCGPWQFDTQTLGNLVSYATWQAGPSSQDPGSTLNGPSCTVTAPPSPPGRAGGQRPVTVPIRVGRR